MSEKKRKVGRPKSDRRTHTFPVVLDWVMWERVVEVAAAEQVSKGEIIRRALNHAFESH